jgi:excisionase family DNA binding protein
MSENDVKVFTVEEVSAILKTSEKTLARIMDSGALKWCQVGGQRRITKDQIDEYLKSVEKV